MGESREGTSPVTLADATDVDAVARSALRELMGLVSVRRAGIALVEGGGRRLRFLVTDSLDASAPDWCHIDAYEDVPLTTVVRSGEPVLGGFDDLAVRYPALIAQQRDSGGGALAAVPLLGEESPIGGLVVYYDDPQRPDQARRDHLEQVGRRTTLALSRLRARFGRPPAAPAEAPADVAHPGRRANLHLADDTRAAAAARRFLRETLADWSIDGDAVDNAELCLSELVTNAVIHAGTGSELSLTLEDGVLSVAVRDRGGHTAAAGADRAVHLCEDEDPMRVFGRGLVLVDALADRWGSDVDATGTTSWFAIEVGDLCATS